MFEAAERARAGDLPYFEALPEAELKTLLVGRDEDGRTLLHSAAAQGHLPLVQLLATAGAGKVVNKQDDAGWSPLHSASAAGHGAVAQALLALGADPALVTDGGQTPLHYAASKGGPALCRLLIAHGARVSARDALGATPLHRAAGAGVLESAQVLVEHGGQGGVDAADRSGQTPLFVAIAARNAAVAVFLASRGAKLDSTTKEGETPLQAAGDLAQELRRAAEAGPAAFSPVAQRA
jgi:26S proteasome non-ATPase regulatory subunit 10